MWTSGDFNYDNVVNTLDFNLLAANFGLALASSPAVTHLGATVPEPALSMTLGVVMLIGMRRSNNAFVPTEINR